MSAAANWRIDPDPAAEPSARALFADDGEHRRAVARLDKCRSAGAVPDEVWLHLHGYELLESMRAAQLEGATQLQFPFWPESLFAAADVLAHGARELERCMPAPGDVTCVWPTLAAIEQAARRLLGDVRFDPERYRWSLGTVARARGWRLLAAPASPAPELPSPLLPAGARGTAGAFVIDRGKLWLEWRPHDARVYAGLWDTPGGHLEPGEAPAHALVRELDEELGIAVERARLGVVQDDRDPTSGAAYRHFVFVVDAFSGSVQPRRGQRLLTLPPGDCLRLHGLNPLVATALRQVLDRGSLSC